MMIDHETSFDNTARASKMEKVRAWSRQNPEWWIFALAVYVWGMMFILAFAPSDYSVHNSSLIFCIPSMGSASDVATGLTNTGILKEPSLSTKIQFSLVNGIIPWVFMLIAMMFPLLKRPVRHVNSSLQREDTELGILVFLAGYCIVWTFVGGVFLLIPPVIDALFESSPNAEIVLHGLVFFVAAVAVWLPSRETAISRCDQTRPLHINGARRFASCFQYGIQIGVSCFRMCWAPMLALVLANHSLLLMLAVTTIMIVERYRLKYTRHLPGYAWAAIGTVLILTSL